MSCSLLPLTCLIITILPNTPPVAIMQLPITVEQHLSLLFKLADFVINVMVRAAV